jgi:hypothetical protein
LFAGVTAYEVGSNAISGNGVSFLDEDEPGTFTNNPQEKKKNLS